MSVAEKSAQNHYIIPSNFNLTQKQNINDNNELEINYSENINKKNSKTFLMNSILTNNLE